MPKLSEIASIRAGYRPRSRSKDKPGEKYKIIQMGDLNHNGTIEWEGLESKTLEGVNETHLLEEGNILFSSRGQRAYGAIVDRPCENILAASNLFVIQINLEDILSTYLLWFINNTPGQRYISSRQEGTTIQKINKKTLLAMEVNIPPRKIQEKVAEIYRLQLREKELLKEVEKKRSQLRESVILRSVQKGE